MDWVFRYAGPTPVVDEVIKTTGAVLVGRRSYDVGARAQPPEMRKVFGGAWSGPQFVLTHTAPERPSDPMITFLSGGVRSAVGTALEAARGKNVIVIGANVAQQCLDEGLVEEILIHLAPILLGDGVRMFSRLRNPPVDLETISVTQSGQLTNLRFRVAKQAASLAAGFKEISGAVDIVENK